MSNEIKPKRGTLTGFTLNPASLADGAARQSTLIDPEEQFEFYKIFCQVTLGTSPDQGQCPIYLIEGDSEASTPITTDSAVTTEAAITIVGAPIIGVLPTKVSPATNDILRQVFTIRTPAIAWGIAVGNDTGVAFKSDGHKFRYQGFNPEVQDAA
jgi:hypothetical protein